MASIALTGQAPAKGNWADLVTQSRRFQESQAEGIVEAEIHARQLAGELTEALEGLDESWFHEDHLALHLEDIAIPSTACAHSRTSGRADSGDRALGCTLPASLDWV